MHGAATRYVRPHTVVSAGSAQPPGAAPLLPGPDQSPDVLHQDALRGAHEEHDGAEAWHPREIEHVSLDERLDLLLAVEGAQDVEERGQQRREERRLERGLEQRRERGWVDFLPPSASSRGNDVTSAGHSH